MKSLIKMKKRCVFVMFVLIFLIIGLSGRFFYLQLIEYKGLAQKSEEQSLASRSINCKRGVIYDSTEKNILAQSSTVYTVTISPVNIKKEEKERISNALSEILEIPREKVDKAVNKRTSIEYIAKRIEKDKTDKLREWMNLNNIFDGINIDEDTKRFYPYSTLAAQVIGFCGTENQGLDGIEAKYNDTLIGRKGYISKMIDAKGRDFGEEGEQYENPVSGCDLVLSIDMTIQSIVEKYLEEACIDNECTDGGNIIIMNPKNGDVLAMATYPFYDLNNPYYIENTENIVAEEKSKMLQSVWRNRAIADTYEPGSTFKLVTASAAIEEGLASTDNQGAFCCTGRIDVAGTKIKCWRYYRPHGSQSLRQALMNSCNPVFIGLGQKIGVEKYYSYLEKFGFLRKTGIDLYGEANSIFLKKEKVGPVELATISFGQRFEVTPIQMITMVSTIANKGEYVKPRIVKKIIDENGVEKEIFPEKGVQVIKSETAENVLSMMESVVAEGTGKNAQVKGYRVGGKTGTSEDGVNTGKYVTSFIGVAPIDDPQVTILVTLYNPTGQGGHQGGGVAAPVGGQILNEVLNYVK